MHPGSEESGDRWRKSGGTDWGLRTEETNYQNQIPGNYKPTMITNHHCYISSAALKLENLVNKAIIRTGNRRNQTWKIYQGTKIVSLFWSNDALGTSQLFEDATKIKVHGIIWLMAGFRVAKVTLVPLCVKLEIHHSSAHRNNIKAKYWISPLMSSSFRVNIFKFLHFCDAVSQERTRAKPRRMFTWVNY